MKDILFGFLCIHALLWVLYAIRSSEIVDYLTGRTRRSGLVGLVALIIAAGSGVLAALITL